MAGTCARWRSRIALLPVVLVALLVGSGFALGTPVPSSAQAPAWEALGPGTQPVTRLFTPTSGALLARGEAGLSRSDDGGLTWAAIAGPHETSVVTVSPESHALLYAAGAGGVFRSDDGGGSWQPVSDRGGQWLHIEVSPADPSTLYGVVLTSPPAEYGQNRWRELQVSHDGGVSWEITRTQRERVVPGTQPCGYTFRLVQPLATDPNGVVTVEGCTGRGADPAGSLSLDEGRTAAFFPKLEAENWGTTAIAGGRGASPSRWYAAVFQAGIPYSRVHHSRVMRSDDGAAWTTILESSSGGTSPDKVQPVDFVTALAHNPARPDDVYVIVEHREPVLSASGSLERHEATATQARVSRDGGATWTDLGAPGLPAVRDLAVGIDGKYLFAATAEGVHRLALP